jgi:hypothetical protein
VLDYITTKIILVRYSVMYAINRCLPLNRVYEMWA